VVIIIIIIIIISSSSSSSSSTIIVVNALSTGLAGSALLVRRYGLPTAGYPLLVRSPFVTHIKLPGQ
jgi:hypothetical protein